MTEDHTPFTYIDDKAFLDELENRYEFEDKIYICVNQGLAHLVPTIFDNFVNRPPEDAAKYVFTDYMATAKLFCRSLNLSGRIAARSAGLPSFCLHKISEDFGIIINESNDPEFLIHILPKEIIGKYANSVVELSTTNYSPLVAKAIQYISSHLPEHLEASQIAHNLYISPEHLSRKFKADTGKNIPDYINNKRIAMAKILLSRNAKNITEVAIQVGYRDSSYFSKSFKKVEGVTPKEYLNQLKFTKS